MSLVETPWMKQLEDVVSATKTDLIVTTPFFSSKVLRRIFAKCGRKVKIRLLLGKITAQTLAERTTDPDILKEILLRRHNIECKCIENLHAKVLVADGMGENPRAIVTSANLTNEGLSRNIELGVMVKGALAKEIAKRLIYYWKKGETLSKENFFTVLKESENVKRTKRKGTSASIGPYVSPKGISHLDLVVNEHTIRKIIKDFRHERGFGYPEKKRDFHAVQNKLLKIRKRDLDKTELEDMLNTIDRWTGAIRIGNMKRVLTNDIIKINSGLKMLLDESKPLIDRVDLLLNKNYKLNGVSLGIISVLLFVNDFENYNIYNERVLRGLVRAFGPKVQRVYDGITYETFNSAVVRFKKLFDLQPMETDWVLSKLGK